MKCPVDNTTLQIAERQGVEIDYCPECRGVWLDRGELDKIIDRSSSDEPSRSESRQPYAPRDSYSESHESDDHHDGHNNDRQNGKRRKESFLGDLFDFGG